MGDKQSKEASPEDIKKFFKTNTYFPINSRV